MKTRLLALIALVAAQVSLSSCGKTETTGGTKPEPVPGKSIFRKKRGFIELHN